MGAKAVLRARCCSKDAQRAVAVARSCLAHGGVSGRDDAGAMESTESSAFGNGAAPVVKSRGDGVAKILGEVVAELAATWARKAP